MNENKVNKLVNDEQVNNNGLACILLHGFSPALLMMVFWVLLKLC